ncbi:two-component regulator propeller domain-containing protein [Acidobacteriota bacterium]
MKKSTFTALLFLWLSLSVCLWARTIRFKHISLDEGLSQNAVFCLIQDSKGFMWFGTQDGLNKYDGYTFTVYKPDPDNISSLSHSWITALCEDDSGMIWIGTNGGGLNKFDTKKEEFYRYRVVPDDPDCINCGFIRAICQDNSGTMWIGTTRGGIYTIIGEADRGNPESIREKIVNHRNIPGDPNSLSSNRVNAVLEDRSGVIWIGTGSGLEKFDKQTGQFAHYKNIPGDISSLSHNSVLQIYEDRAGLLWVGTNSGLNLMDKKAGKFTRYQHQPNDLNSISRYAISTIIEDRSGVLWVGTRGGGLNKFDKRTETFSHFRHRADDPHSLSYNYVSCIYEDTSRILWVGTSGKGLNKFDREDKFVHYQFVNNNPNTLSDNYVYSIFEDHLGILWIGTANGGLNKFDRKAGTFTHYRNNAGSASSLSHNAVRSILEDRSGVLWIGTGGGGLNRFNRKTGTFTRFRRGNASPGRLSHDTVYSIFEDHSGTLWIGTGGGGINKFDRNAGTFTHYRRNEDDPNSLSGDSVSTIYEAPTEPGILWIGTRNRGLNRFDPGREVFTRFITNPDNPDSLSANFVLSVYEDRGGTLWIGTYGGGLNKLIGKRDKNDVIRFAHYTEKSGLPNNSIYGILEDEAGNLWMSTNKGISKFDPLNEIFKNYNSKDGLQGSEFNGGAYHRNRRGEMFFGGIKGFNAFFPADIKDNPYIPPIVITGFRISNIPVPIGVYSPLKKSIIWTEKIELTYKQNALSFEFAALDFTIPENNRYAYKMEGFDTGWNITDSSKRFAFYTNLDPGHYVLRVRGSNNDGVWNETGASVKITILPPFWETWWFIFLLLFTGSGLLLFFSRRRINRVKRKSKEEKIALKREMEKQQLEKELKLKADFTVMLVHDLRSPLSAVIGFSEILIETPELVDIGGIGEAIKLSSGRMLTLVNEMLDYSKFEAGKMALDKKETYILRLTEDIVEMMAPLFDQKRIHLVYDVPPKIRDTRLSLDPEKISQVVNNFFSNAIKFAPMKGVVTLGMRLVDMGFVEISVKDNGPGIPRNKQKYIFDKYAQLTNNEQVKGTGLGLAVSKMIIEAHGGVIGYRTKEGEEGSIFFFRLPE